MPACLPGSRSDWTTALTCTAPKCSTLAHHTAPPDASPRCSAGVCAAEGDGRDGHGRPAGGAGTPRWCWCNHSYTRMQAALCCGRLPLLYLPAQWRRVRRAQLLVPHLQPAGPISLSPRPTHFKPLHHLHSSSSAQVFVEGTRAAVEAATAATSASSNGNGNGLSNGSAAIDAASVASSLAASGSDSTASASLLAAADAAEATAAATKGKKGKKVTKKEKEKEKEKPGEPKSSTVHLLECCCSSWKRVWHGGPRGGSGLCRRAESSRVAWRCVCCWSGVACPKHHSALQLTLTAVPVSHQPFLPAGFDHVVLGVSVAEKFPDGRLK